MELIKFLQKHIKDISIGQETNLHREIDSFISLNSNLNDTELFDEVYTKYASRIKFLENAVQCKAIVAIKSWVTIIGSIFLLAIAICIFYVLCVSLK